MRSLYWQLTAAIALAVLLSLAAAQALSNLLLNRLFETYMTQQQEVVEESIVANIAAQYENGAWNVDGVYAIGMLFLYDGVILRIEDAKGGVVWDAQNHDMSRCKAIMEEIPSRMARLGQNGEFSRRVYRLKPHGEEIGTLTIGSFAPYSLSESDFSFLRYLNAVPIAAFLFALAISAAIGLYMARRIAKPIAKTARIAREIAGGGYGARFGEKSGTKEIEELSTAINHLAGSLGEQEQLRRQLTADVAHEIRTPLAAIGSHLEAMIEGVWQPTKRRLKSCHEEILRLNAIVADLESIERGRLNRTPADLLALAKIAGESFGAELARKKIALRVEGVSAVAPIDRDRMMGVVSNLLSNAIKYSKEEGRVTITTADFPERCELRVADDGIGIKDEDIPFIFERFYRADKSRSRGTGGAGLGLAIVKSAVEAHGGGISVTSAIGKGSVFVVTLPK
ncbi:MAG: HAMP domain-containing histidine kinase [Helicobacteraceae bacterium]|jgi:signal transduction histidine kinase|nr:HAMP domain-containing histidine kinase [Helicobacteraceae bacterium]